MNPLETLIVSNIGRFDPISLLYLLTHIGYGLDDILFCSHFSICSQSRLIESIEFRSGTRQVIIQLNFGLLGGQSALPNYLFKAVDQETIDARQFVEFFGFFDDRLLRRFLLAVYPEIDDALYRRSWENRKADLLYTLKLDGIASLHWLARLVFPELQVRVEKLMLKRRYDLVPLVLGKTKLGYQAVFGKKKELPVMGKRITLIADDYTFVTGQPWPREIEQRLENLVFPILRKVVLDLEIWLIIRDQKSWLRLEQNSYLGYENMLNDTVQCRRIRIFSGRLFDWH